jgi:hypothetical protein
VCEEVLFVVCCLFVRENNMLHGYRIVVLGLEINRNDKYSFIRGFLKEKKVCFLLCVFSHLLLLCE